MSDSNVGAIIGALSAILGSIISGVIVQIIKSKTNEQHDNRKNLIMGCEDAKKLLYFIATSPEKVTDDLIINIKIKLSIYASENLSNCFDSIIEKIKMHQDYNNQIIEFNRLIKKELHIKNK